MVVTVFLGLLIVLGLVGVVFGFFIPKEVNFTDQYGRNSSTTKLPRKLGRAGGVALIVVGVIAGLGAMYTTVPAKNVGVQSAFGKIEHEYSPGLHWIAPWVNVTNIPDTIQTDDYEQTNGSGAYTVSNSGVQGYCITVRLAGQQEGCADVQLQDEILPNSIPTLYADYSSYGGSLQSDIQTYVVKRGLTTVLNRILGDYNPVEDVSSTFATGGSQFSEFDSQLLSSLQSEVGSGVKIDNLNLQYVHYDSTTQARINSIAEQYAATQVAVQEEKTNAAISAANAALVKTNSLTPAVLEEDCYTTTQAAIKAGYQLPTGWSCYSSNGNLILGGGK